MNEQKGDITESQNGRRGFAVRSLKSQADARRTLSEKFADSMTALFGTVTFLLLNATLFAVWIPINLGLMPGVGIFDPFPFVLLTTIVSIEAIFLAIIVLISQNRAAHVADVREEIDLHINKISEAEITQIIKMLAELSKKQGLDVSGDPEVVRMLKPISSGDIERKVEAQTSPKTKPVVEWNPLIKR